LNTSLSHAPNLERKTKKSKDSREKKGLRFLSAYLINNVPFLAGEPATRGKRIIERFLNRSHRIGSNASLAYIMSSHLSK
jgi:hypothetical protein